MSQSTGQIAFWIGLLALWFVLNRWVLPKLGFRT
jgi:hypothetical protein